MDYIIHKITGSEDELLAGLEHPEYVAAKIEHLKPGSRRRLEVLAVRRALKELLGEEYEVLYDELGAPRLANNSKHISISHTNDYVAVIADEQSPVGIDIERRGTRVQKVVSHFLRPEELELLSQTGDMDLALHLAWSAKEAAYKVLGHEYYDLQHLTTIKCMDMNRQTIELHAVHRELPLALNYSYTEEYVVVWLTLPDK